MDNSLIKELQKIRQPSNIASYKPCTCTAFSYSKQKPWQNENDRKNENNPENEDDA